MMTTIEKSTQRRNAEYGATSAEFDGSWKAAAGRFLPDRFYLAGLEALPLDIPDWTKPNEGKPRLFKNDFLERLTLVHPATPLVLFVPQVMFLLFLGALRGLGPLKMGALFTGGLFFWTFTEYGMHRLAFHFVPRNRWQVVFAYFLHGIHHAFPDDDRRLVMPPVMSLTLAIPFYLLFMKVLAGSYMPALAGFLVGYLWYDMTHYALHALPMRSKLGNALRKHHMLHHFSTPDRRFGVSTPLWDVVLGTWGAA